MGYSSMMLYGHSKNFRVRCMGIYYPDNSCVIIYVLKYQHMNPVDPNRIWNIELYKKEKLGYAFTVVNNL
jgi:hypothetical protein